MRRKHFLALILVAIIMVLMMNAIVMIRISDRFRVVNLEKKWDLYVNGLYLGNTSYDNAFSKERSVVDKGDILELKTVIPEDLKCEFPSLFIGVFGASYDVMIDDKVYRSVNTEKTEHDAFIGWDYSAVSLPDHIGGRKLTLRLYPAQDKLAKPLMMSLFGELSDLEQWFLHKNIVPFITGSLLLISGGFLMIISLVFTVKNPDFASHIVAALLTITLGITMFSYYGLASLMLGSKHETLLYYIAIHMVVLLCALWCGRIRNSLYRRLYFIFIFAYSAYIGVRVFLHISGKIFINIFFPLIFLFMVCFVVLSILDIFYDRGHTLTEELDFQYAGVFVGAAFMTLSWVLTYLKSLRIINYDSLIINASAAVLAIGMLVFPMCHIAGYLFFAAKSYNKNIEYTTLTQTAYRDVLTSLPNRAHIDHIMDEFEKENASYAVISFDLNDLKKTNDTYGHESGDVLLRNFAYELDNVFGREGVCGRIGGDEFVVLAKNVREDKLREMLNKLENRLKQLNDNKIDPWEYHTAYGYAYRREASGAAQTIKLADSRMYEKKQSMKNMKNMFQ
ncbi:MAG: GGDEF domain-containing protein [Lachnospiraceae bacterium]|nr:GGDEF domain-containing protein [Lachnospiraceae bacterium]